MNFTVKPENDMRNQAAQEFANQSGQFDVATLSNFEIPFYSKNGWLTSMDDIPAYKSDTAFNQADIFPSMTNSLKGPDGKLYGEPFYGESSFLMYRKDIAEKVGVKFNETPTWDEVAAAAAKMDGAESGMKGICLRGLPGWGEVFAPLTTVVNTFGGTWFDKDWNAQVNAQPFKDATTFYTDLVKAHGESGAAQAGFAECLTATTQSKVAMWYDATSAAGSLEAPDSPVKGKMGYVQAPVKETKSSGWLYAWSWAIEKKSTEGRQRLEVHLLGVLAEVRGARRCRRTAGRPCPPASVSRPTPTPTTSRPPRRSPSRPRRPSRAPTRRTPASSRGRRSASSSSTSPSSPTSPPRSARTSPR